MATIIKRGTIPYIQITCKLFINFPGVNNNVECGVTFITKANSSLVVEKTEQFMDGYTYPWYKVTCPYCKHARDHWNPKIITDLSQVKYSKTMPDCYIIREQTKSVDIPIHSFNCKHCKCEFTAREDYLRNYKRNYQDVYAISCPECNTNVENEGKKLVSSTSISLKN